jgi:hypothetical protein
LDDQALWDTVKLGDGIEGLTLALLCALAVASVKQCDVLCAVIMDSNGGAHTGIHAAT